MHDPTKYTSCLSERLPRPSPIHLVESPDLRPQRMRLPPDGGGLLGPAAAMATAGPPFAPRSPRHIAASLSIRTPCDPPRFGQSEKPLTTKEPTYAFGTAV